MAEEQLENGAVIDHEPEAAEQEGATTEAGESGEGAATTGTDTAAKADDKAADKPDVEDPNAKIRDEAFKLREAKREAKEARERADQIQQELDKLRAPVRPDIPKIPDRYDFASDADFDKAVQDRDALIAAATRWDQQQAFTQQQQQALEQQKVREQQEAMAKQAEAYKKQADVLGVPQDEMVAGGELMIKYQMPLELMQRVLNDERGPEITAYLGKNPLVLGQIVDMNPMDAAVFIETTVKPAAKRAPPQKVPAPPKSPGGAGLADNWDGPAGATYT